MSHEAFDEDQIPESRNAFWLRRVLVVLAGLLALSLLWWIGSSLFGGDDKESPVVASTPQNSEVAVVPSATPTPTPSTDMTPSATPAASGAPVAPTSGSASASVSPTMSSSALSTGTPAASASASSTPTASASASASTPAATGSVVCDPAKMSVKVNGASSVTIGKPTPIGVSFSNGGANECYLDFAKTPLSFKITSGSDVYLTSGTCPAFAPSGVVPIPAGKSWEWKLTWGEKRATGCTLGASNVSPGTYVANAKLADVVGSRLVMVLHR